MGGAQHQDSTSEEFPDCLQIGKWFQGRILLSSHAEWFRALPRMRTPGGESIFSTEMKFGKVPYSRTAFMPAKAPSLAPVELSRFFSERK
jgi:hypothetical protein